MIQQDLIGFFNSVSTCPNFAHRYICCRGCYSSALHRALIALHFRWIGMLARRTLECSRDDNDFVTLGDMLYMRDM